MALSCQLRDPDDPRLQTRCYTISTALDKPPWSTWCAARPQADAGTPWQLTIEISIACLAFQCSALGRLRKGLTFIVVGPLPAGTDVQVLLSGLGSLTALRLRTATG